MEDLQNDIKALIEGGQQRVGTVCIRTGEILNIPDVSLNPDYVEGWKDARSSW